MFSVMDDRGKATHARFTSESQITPPSPQGILGGHGGDDYLSQYLFINLACPFLSLFVSIQ